MVCTHTDQLLENQRRLKEGKKKVSKMGVFNVFRVHLHLLCSLFHSGALFPSH